MPKEQVNLYVGTRKGSYVVRSDQRRRNWKVDGPFHEDADVFHVAPDPRHSGHVYSLANSPFWGPVLYRSTDGGRRWKEIATPGLDRRSARKPAYGGPRSEPVQNLWHFEPGPVSAPRRLYIGIDPHGLYRSDDLGASWTEVAGIAKHPTREMWTPGAGGRCLHTVLIDQSRPGRLYVGISAAGTFRSDDDGESWAPKNRNVRTDFLPNKSPEVGQCVHHVAMDPADPQVLYRQDHCGIYVSEDGADRWVRVGKSLPSDFGFVVATAAALPGGAIFAPLHPTGRRMADHRLQLQFYDRARRQFRPMLRPSRFVGDFGTHREALATDTLDPAGIYLGTTTGDLVYTPNGGRSWGAVPFRFPTIHSVSAAVAGRS
jgi:hypothetical protein